MLCIKASVACTVIGGDSIQSGKGTCELENLPALIGYLTGVGGDFGKVYKTLLGLALMGLA